MTSVQVIRRVYGRYPLLFAAEHEQSRQTQHREYKCHGTGNPNQDLEQSSEQLHDRVFLLITSNRYAKKKNQVFVLSA